MPYLVLAIKLLQATLSTGDKTFTSLSTGDKTFTSLSTGDKTFASLSTGDKTFASLSTGDKTFASDEIFQRVKYLITIRNSGCVTPY